ncbi:hypothetical protein A0H81_04298 [Grifola frondosa]|uniref:Uncharacterized protein n=1 Tax=Grifola frondosa TaxID=5627 RepID=A0A1C7MK68_GRIFR|nr:hypothetical protein A0H81_04298 [Grifola frondosa]
MTRQIETANCQDTISSTSDHRFFKNQYDSSFSTSLIYSYWTEDKVLIDLNDRAINTTLNDGHYAPEPFAENSIDVSNAVGTYIVTTAPNPSPQKNERGKFGPRPDIIVVNGKNLPTQMTHIA